MDDKQENRIHTTGEELDTTAPSPLSEEWKMPAPIFRSSSGRLHKDVEQKAAVSFSSAEDLASLPLAATPEVQAHAEPHPKSAALKFVVLALALGAMIAFIILFLTVIYFF